MRTKRCKRESFVCAFASVTLTILADSSKVNMALFKITFSVIWFGRGEGRIIYDKRVTGGREGEKCF